MNIKLRHSIWGRLFSLIFGGVRHSYIDADIVACTVEDASRAEVVIVWAWNLDATSVPDVSAFTIAGKTITNVAVAGGLVTLTVSVAYDFGDVPGDVVYVAPALNPLKQESSGSVVNNFTETITSYITYPAALDDGHHWWYDATDLTQVTKDGSNLVSVWHSKGVADRTLLQATGTNQPLWVSPGTIRFDGIDNFLKTAAFTWNQPCFVYMLVKQITWTNYDTIFDGNTSFSLCLRQRTTSPVIVIRAPNDVASNSDLILNTWAVVRVLTNGANSKIQVNNSAATTGECTSNAGGFTVGARGAGNGAWSNIEVKDIVCCDQDDAANEAEIYAFLLSRKP